MQKVRLVLAALASVLLVTACAPSSGTVIQKQHIDAHFDYWQSSDCIASVPTYRKMTSTGKYGTRTSTVMSGSRCIAYAIHSHRVWHTDQWGLRLRNGSDVGYAYVSYSTWIAYSVGQQYP